MQSIGDKKHLQNTENASIVTSDEQRPLSWQIGAECEIFCDEDSTWKRGQIINAYSTNQGQRVKVIYDQKEKDNISWNDPRLKAVLVADCNPKES